MRARILLSLAAVIARGGKPARTGRAGIGFYIENVRLNGLITEMWAAILVTGVLGYLVNTLFMTVERVALPWSPENRAR